MGKKIKKRSFRHNLQLFIKTSSWLKIVSFLFLVVLISSAIVFIIEQPGNSGFKTFFDSVWWSIVTVSTVGYGDRLPDTFYGRIIAVATIFIGMGIMGTITGRIASILMERQMKEEQGLLDYTNSKDHFLICGWKREMNEILHEILNANPEFTPLDLILLNKAPADDVKALRSDSELKGFRFVNGDMVEERELMRAGIKGASRVLVMADYLTKGDLRQIDSKTVMTVMTIKNLNKKAYVCAELLDTKFEKYLKLSHCDEVLLSRNFSRAVLSSASSGAGLSHVLDQLMSRDSDTGISTKSFPNSFIGKTYGDLVAHYMKKNIQLIGLLENTGNIMERKRDALREAQMNPDISALIPELQNVKNLESNKPVINPPRDYVINKYSRGITIIGTTVNS